MISKKAECNILGIFGLILLLVGFWTKNEYVSGAGFGILVTAMYFRVDYLRPTEGQHENR